MRKNLSAAWVAVAILWGCHSAAWAQWTSSKVDVYGTFGRRSLGQTIKPKPSLTLDGLQRGPSGVFIGRGRPYGGMMFYTPRGKPYLVQRDGVVIRRQPPLAPANVGPTDWYPAQRPAIPGPALEMEPPVPAEPRPIRRPPDRVRPPEPTRRPDIWFRAEPPEASSGATTPPGGNRILSPSGIRLQAPTPPPLVVGFSKASPSGNPGPALGDRIRQCPQIRTLSPVQVAVENGTAVLRGRVATDHDQTLAENLARLEPGVWQIRSEMSVGTLPLRSTASAGGN